MIIGAHSIISSSKSDEDRAFLRDVLGLSHVDVGGGWLIFGLPPAEVAVHPSDGGPMHQFYLMCDDVQSFIAEMATRNVVCAPVQDQDWGLLTEITLPGGFKLGVYQPRHQRPPAMRATAESAETAETPTVAQRVRKLIKKVTKKLGNSVRSTPAAKKPAAKKAAKAAAKPGKKAGKKPAAKPAKKPAKKAAKRGK
jgi:hypothetical protein